MANLCAKLKQREKNKYRKILSTGEPVYSNEDIQITSSTPYAPGTALEDGEWFSIPNAANQGYKIDLLVAEHNPVDFDSLNKNDFGNIDFLFTEINNLICFQNVSRAKLVSKKCILCLGQEFEYQTDRREIIINNLPDAIYNKDTNVLFFRRLESITSIFRGIDQLYKEATEAETTQFLSSEFIQLKEDYNASRVKTANRKRIALAQSSLANLDADSRNNIFTYIGEYCPDLKVSDTSFEIGNEDEMKMLLYGIEQRFYTTIVGGEKRIANSVVPFG
ncbi:hypothetical protein [Pygmaiobacter massiliensis]|uniref:hypothetical protein n=1 Tax=Pygmaiobacter massiliensis TaxID=1917873 RepID=UPI00289D7485|nr:hypothetical protein [Pygmaiobacter massiliensis]